METAFWECPEGMPKEGSVLQAWTLGSTQYGRGQCRAIFRTAFSPWLVTSISPIIKPCFASQHQYRKGMERSMNSSDPNEEANLIMGVAQSWPCKNKIMERSVSIIFQKYLCPIAPSRPSASCRRCSSRYPGSRPASPPQLSPF
ncbi:MAG: hypothetical protein A4E49_03393 [Methanosaeta sp. PtaU1.Bin112]|nr:MAG: hypothetical protein A4E49_03393 [Methanosaeta sp. PtaU1.Bin112]